MNVTEREREADPCLIQIADIDALLKYINYWKFASE